MELMEGSLEDYSTKNNLSAELCVSILKQTLSALAYLHERSLIHGSIRPSNILIDEFGNVKLSDFAEQSADGSMPPPESRHCRYVAPEIWDSSRFGPIGPTLDLYALGMTVLSCISGQELSNAEKSNPTGMQPEMYWARWHTSQDHQNVVQALAGKKLGDRTGILLRMLQQKASGRPHTASELLEALSSATEVRIPISPPDIEFQSERTPSSDLAPTNPFPFSNSVAPKASTKTKSSTNWLPQNLDLSDQVTFRWHWPPLSLSLPYSALSIFRFSLQIPSCQ